MGIKAAVDAIIEKDGKILLVLRKSKPFKGKWALPGGGVEEGERVEQALVREVEEETSLIVKPIEILGVYSDPERDPRGHVISTVFIAEVVTGNLEAGGDAAEVQWFEPKEIDWRNLAFDHAKILSHYLEWKEKKRTFWSSL